MMFANNEGRITEIGNFSIEVVPSGFMLLTKNKDIPGVIGKIGTLLGAAEVNISRFYLGREAKGGEALAIIEIDSPLEEKVLTDLRNLEAVNVARQVKL
jgi:D-3-phosphoglycerate dehydrogenase